MEKITGNEPAMPTQMPDYKIYADENGVENTYFYNKQYSGLTIRQQFAMAAPIDFAIVWTMLSKTQDVNTITPEDVIKILAMLQVAYADALINELNK